MKAGQNARGRRKALAQAALATVQVAIVATAYAQDQGRTIGWGLNLGVEHSDNVARSADNEQDETVGIAGLQLAIDADNPRLDAAVSADLQYRDYLDNTFESEVVGGFFGNVTYAFVPERFLWTVEDNYGQVANQRQLADTPGNRQDFNYFSTGPDVIIPFGGRTQAIIAGRWSDAYYEDGTQVQPGTFGGTVSESEELTGSLALLHQLSDTDSVSLNGSHSETTFDDELVDDYEIQEAFVRYAMDARRTQLSIDAGYTVLKQAGESSDGILARLDLTRRVAARSTVGLQVGTEFSTTADTFRRDQTIVGAEVGPGAAVASSDAFQTDYGYVTWTTDWPRSTLSIELSAREEDHEELTFLDREQLAALFTWSRRMTANIGLDLRGGYTDEKFIETGQRFDEWVAGFGLNWQLGRNFGLELTANHFEGSGDGAGRDYDENRAYIGVTYGRGM
jgi:hypothetical protein